MEADEHILTLRYTCNVVLFSFYSWSENSFYLWRFKHWWNDIWMLDCELFESGSIKGRVPKVTKSGAIVLHIFPLILLWWKKTAFLVVPAIVPFCKNLCTSELCYLFVYGLTPHGSIVFEPNWTWYTISNRTIVYYSIVELLPKRKERFFRVRVQQNTVDSKFEYKLPFWRIPSSV